LWLRASFLSSFRVLSVSQALSIQVQVQVQVQVRVRWRLARVLRISDSFGYLQRSLQGLFVGRVRRFRAEVLYIVCGDSKEESETYCNVREPAKSLSLGCS
jgi:hypothetical protein